jgi:16S rRNA (adenine1518-N6/adenine1519-N6)-dimethyltransferase
MPIPPRELIAAFSHRARKSLGQNFLTDTDVLRSIAEAAELTAQTTVFEVGPGPGVLTQELLARAGRVVAVEKDERAVSFLGGPYRQMIAGAPNLTVMEGDALTVDIDAAVGSTGDLVAAGNLPFNVGTAILNRLLADPARWRAWVFMFQREVALRLTAVPNTKAYGSLSLAVQSRTRVSAVVEVPPEAFMPAPRIHAGVVLFDLRDPPAVPLALQPSFDRVVRSAFATRRKTLRNNLRRLWGAETDAVLDTAGVDGGKRPEQLPLSSFAALARAVEDRNSA